MRLRLCLMYSSTTMAHPQLSHLQGSVAVNALYTMRHHRSHIGSGLHMSLDCHESTGVSDFILDKSFLNIFLISAAGKYSSSVGDNITFCLPLTQYGHSTWANFTWPQAEHLLRAVTSFNAFPAICRCLFFICDVFFFGTARRTDSTALLSSPEH